MKNFLTYDSCEVFPGPKLNVVLGPNGTGKSTVTHAICLACGGEPKVLGRSNELSQFVKHGKHGEEAFAEVDVLDENRVHTIRRTIQSESNSSKWRVNGANATKDQVKTLLKKLKIDVDNLCSFMSQDKVGLFSQQTPVGILKMTLQCIAIKDTDRTLLDEQTELASHEKAKGDQERDLSAKQQTFDKKVSELNKLEAEVANVRQRQEKKDLLKKYEMKRTVAQSKKDRDTLRVKSDALEKAQETKAVEEQKIHPLEEAERDAKRKLDQHDATVRLLVGKNKESESRVSDLKMELKAASQSSQDIVNDLKEFESNRRTMEKRIADARARVKKCEADLAKANERLPDYQVKLKQLTEEIRAERAVEESLEEEIKDITSKIGDLNAKKVSLTSRIQKHQDSASLFRAKLKGWADRFKDPVVSGALKVFDFIHSNKEGWKQQRKLKGEVYGPAAYYMQVEDSVCAIILERAIPRNTLLSCYITESIEDERFLKAQVTKFAQDQRDRDLRADYFTVTNITDEARQRPFDKRYLDRFKGSMGMQGYLGDTFQTIDIVRGYFADRTGISRTLWCRGPTDKITDQQVADLCGAESYVNLYSHNTKDGSITEYKISKQRYDSRGTLAFNTGDVKRFNNILGPNSDTTLQKDQLVAELEEVKEQVRALERDLKSAREQLGRVVDPLTAKRQSVNQLREGLKLPDVHSRELAKAKKEQQDLEKRHNVNEEEERGGLLKQYQERFSAIMTLVRQVVKEGEGGMRVQLEKKGSEEYRSSLRQVSEDASQLVRSAKRALESFTVAVREAKKEFDDFERVQKASEACVVALIEEMGGQQRFKSQYAAISSETGDAVELEDIVDRIESLRAEIDAGVDNDGLLVHYNRLVSEVASDKVLLEELRAAFNSAEESLVNRSAEWKESVQAISARINASFSEYMKKLQYGGETSLKDHGTFDEYAMNMKVSFRNNSKLTDLDGSRHSGGERAVSTIMYLMALQELTSAPFRVVDEINQGMDERNERLVFDRIVDSCCGDDSKPQYFLVSPKLLQGLARMDNKDVTVLLVLNGPGVPRSLPCIQDVIEHVKEAANKRKRGD